MEQLIQEIQSLEEKLSNLRSQLRKHNDGFVYLTCLRCYGSMTYETYTNKFLVQELCDEYYGDNGIVDVYTTNPNHGIRTYGDVHVMTLEELKQLQEVKDQYDTITIQLGQLELEQLVLTASKATTFKAFEELRKTSACHKPLLTG